MVPPPGDTAKPKPRKRAALKTTIPDDWQPTEAHRQTAREEGRDLQREAQRFRDSAAAHGRRYADWDRAFANWLRSEYGRGNGAGGRQPQHRQPNTPSPAFSIEQLRRQQS